MARIEKLPLPKGGEPSKPSDAHGDWVILGQERLRKELEMCRRIQEELLPRARLRVPFAEVEGVSIPAREVEATSSTTSCSPTTRRRSWWATSRARAWRRRC